ncbi:DUF5107 domain-containing protein [Paraburkholderia tagetis]|uniref:DUF5107 domain-containing protein n=1 Tax=Paraburkholderia tagetis TaxID=2913261 RepID=A0A9X1UHG8_9BURK|nr:DUF5107 domain-containing protein [Paraburkholderia tagetis]MCG5073702.1 DUF5107 domain-containing protein [Paraburkholderia tagetis]
MPHLRVEIRTERLALPVSRLGPANPLPVFRWQQPTSANPAPPADNLSADELAHTFVWGDASILPYRVQDDYDRDLHPGHLDAVVLDNGLLRATVLPDLGGRLASLIDLSTGAELLFRNPVFQPANLAALNAWFSGGIEWNGLIPGHSPFTCAPVFCGVVETDDGPILRLHEFDRVREASWQIDLFLPDGESRLYVHGRIVNPNPREIACYWWTNAAVQYRPGMRVLAPADYGIEHVLPDNHLERFALDAHGFDASYPEEWSTATSVFFRKPDADRLWIAALDSRGRGLLQTATHEMRGRKMFFFGTGTGGRHWMEVLGRPGDSEYVEIQAGIAPTQDQEFILPAGGSLEWTECWMPFAADAAAVHDPCWHTACSAVRRTLDAQLPAQSLSALDIRLRIHASKPATRPLHRGAVWGKLHEVLTGRPIAPGLDFDAQPGVACPWAELAETGRFSAASLAALPEIWVAGDRWQQALIDSSARHGETWLHALALGIIALDRGHTAPATAFFQRAHTLRPNALSLRNLALSERDVEAAERLYLSAWDALDAAPQLATPLITSLAAEIAEWLLRHNRIAALRRFLYGLSPDVERHERIRLTRARLSLLDGNLDSAEQWLDHDFATIREGETALDEIWSALQIARASRRLGRALSPDEERAVLAASPVPYRLDFRMVRMVRTVGNGRV